MLNKPELVAPLLALGLSACCPEPEICRDPEWVRELKALEEAAAKEAEEARKEAEEEAAELAKLTQESEIHQLIDEHTADCPKVREMITIYPRAATFAEMTIGPSYFEKEYCDLEIEGEITHGSDEFNVQIKILPEIAEGVAQNAMSVKSVMDYLGEKMDPTNSTINFSRTREDWRNSVLESRKWVQNEHVLHLTETINCGGVRIEANHQTFFDNIRFQTDFDVHVDSINTPFPTPADFDLKLTEIPELGYWMDLDNGRLSCDY